MPNPFYYRAALQRLARLADAPHPPHVCVVAAAALARELSPANPRRQLVQRLLHDANPFEFARHKLRDLYDRDDAPSPNQPLADAATSPQDEELPDEDDDPL